MAHEILSVKLCQLDDRLEKVHTRIRMSELGDHVRLRREIGALERECAETDEFLKKSLSRSKAPIASVLSQNYGQIEHVIQETGVKLSAMLSECRNGEFLLDEKILLAEYALDFAHRAAERALLLSLKAIDAQLVWEEKEGKDL